MQKRFLKFSLLVTCYIIAMSGIASASDYDTSSQPSIEIDFDALTKFKPAPLVAPVPAIKTMPMAESRQPKKKTAARRGKPKWAETPLSMRDKLAEQDATNAPEPSTQPHKPQKKKTAAKKKQVHKPALTKNTPKVATTASDANAEFTKPAVMENIASPEPLAENEAPVQPQPPVPAPGYIVNPPAPSPMVPIAAPVIAAVPAPTVAPVAPMPNANVVQNAPMPAPTPAPTPQAIVQAPVMTPPEQPKPTVVPAQPSNEPQSFMDKIKNFFTGDKSASVPASNAGKEDKSAALPPAPEPMPAPGEVQPPQAIAAPTPPVTVTNTNPAPANTAVGTNVAVLTPPSPVAVPKSAPASNELPKGLLTRLEYQQSATDIPNSAALDQLASQMQSDGGQRITITSYATTNDGQSSTARRTSLKRALMIRKYLIDKGIDGSRINVQAMGDSSMDQPQDRVDIARTGS